MQILKMEARNQLKVKFTLALGEKEEIRTKKIFYGSLFFIFFSVLGTLSAWFFKAAWQKTNQRLKMLGQSSVSKFLSRWISLEMLFLILALNLVILGWLNKESIFPIALGKMEEQVVLGAEDAVKINDLSRESLAGNSTQEFLGEEKNPSLSIKEERCQENKVEKKSSELCGEDPQDEELEKELARLDYLDKLKTGKSVKKVQKVSAPKPYISETDSLGRKVCNKSNDKPSKSNQNKGRHLDMECCLDPDENPNPNCYYATAKYGKYL